MIKRLKQYATACRIIRALQIFMMFVALAAVLVVFGFSLNKVTVDDGNSVQTVYSLKTSAKDLLMLAKLDSDKYEVTDVKTAGKEINISLKYTFPVYVTVGDETFTVDAIKGTTVKDAIGKSGVRLDEHDTVNLSLDKALEQTEYIDIIDINYVTETTEKSIPYTSKTVYSGKTTGKTVTTKGSDGTKQVTTLTKYVNGKAVSTETLSETVTKPVVNEVITIGTKHTGVTTSAKVDCISTLKPAKPIELDKNGNPVNYKKHITVQATAYSNEAGNRGASGVVIKPGHVAINTNLYAFGTRFYIKSSDGNYIYGYAVAADTGGFVATRPTNFDLCFATAAECRQFGRRNIEVYILD